MPIKQQTRHRLSDLIISIVKIAGRVPFIPLRLKKILMKKDRRFRFLMPSNIVLTYHEYLGDIKVNIDTVYPIELAMWTGEYDPSTSNVIRKYVNQDSVAVDIGANVGALSLLMAKIAQNGTIFSFEPGHIIYSRLMANLELNPLLAKRVKAHQLGLSDTDESLYWAEDINNRGNANLTNDCGEKVAVTTLDNFISNEKITRLDFIKIDVEGMELEVIKGGIKTIEKFLPVIYYETLEIFRKKGDFDIFEEIKNLLSPLGYTLFFMNSSGHLKSLTNLKDSPANTLAIPKKLC